MKQTFYTKDGATTRDLTQQELEDYAKRGNIEAKTELSKQKIKTLSTDTEKLAEVIKFLGLV